MLIFVYAWLWSQPLSDPTIRCEHGRPVNGNPCERCVRPSLDGKRLHHRIERSYDIPQARHWRCVYCGCVAEGTPYPKLLRKVEDD